MAKEDQFTLSKRALRALSETDAMYPELKKCVHEFGYLLVNQCYQYGVREPNKIRSLILSIWRGAREPTQDPKLGVNHSPVLNNLDWILMNAEAKVSAVQLLRILKDNQLVIVPLEPSTVMVNASVEAVKTIRTVTKAEKHKWRLKCAIEASAKRMWPHLFT